MKRTILFATDTPINNGNGYYPGDIRRIYNIPEEFAGAGQSIGILEFSNGYSIKDAHAFWAMHGITSPAVEFISVDGTRNDNGTSPDDAEASLDLQWAGALAPKAKMLVYEADGGQTYAEFGAALVRTLQYILTDKTHKPSVLSISYGDAESNFSSAVLQQIANLIDELDAAGVTVCIASGDQGAFGMHDTSRAKALHADSPATCPKSVAVGGTSLKPDGSETAWTYQTSENGGATGGGFSQVFEAPNYQSFTGHKGRGIPDVAFNADPATGYQIVFQGQTSVVGGTSVSCPVFAAIVALLNEARAANGLGAITQLVPNLYENASELPFRDVTVGNNSFNGVQGYEAVPGWDACTGFGSVDVTKFIEFFASYSISSNVSNIIPANGSSAGGSGATSPQDPAGAEPFPPFHGILARIQGVISSVLPDEQVRGVSHHHLLVSNVNVLEVEGDIPQDIQSEVFVAIRYGDVLGLAHPIPELRVGVPIELQGQYIPKNLAYPSIGNPGDAVIHYTHYPVGFVVYQGALYK